jgi:hypothetical protein
MKKYIRLSVIVIKKQYPKFSYHLINFINFQKSCFMSQEKEVKKVDPKEFLGAKVISPLEQEKLVGGTADAVKEKEKEKEKEKSVN